MCWLYWCGLRHWFIGSRCHHSDRLSLDSPRMSSAHPTSSHIVTTTPSSKPIDPQKFMLQQLKCCQEMWTAFWARYAFSKHSLDSNLKETPIAQSHLNYRLRPMCSNQEGRISPEKLLFCLIWDQIILLDCSSPLWNIVVLNMQGLFENILGKGGSIDCSAVPAGLLLRLCGQVLQFATTPKIALGFRSLVLEIWERSAGVELQKHLTSCVSSSHMTTGQIGFIFTAVAVVYWSHIYTLPKTANTAS